MHKLQYLQMLASKTSPFISSFSLYLHNNMTTCIRRKIAHIPLQSFHLAQCPVILESSKLLPPGSVEYSESMSSCFLVEYNLFLSTGGSSYIGWGLGVLSNYLLESVTHEIVLLWMTEEVWHWLLIWQKSFPKERMTWHLWSCYIWQWKIFEKHQLEHI